MKINMKINKDDKNKDGKNKLTNYQKFKLELKRIYYFYKEHIDIFILILILSVILLISSSNSTKIKTIKQKGGYKVWNEDLKRSLFDIKNLEKLQAKYPNDPNLVYVIWIISSYFIRPFKLIFGVIILLFGISGSFLFPFLIYGIAMYFVFKKMIKNKAPNPKNILPKKIN